MADNKLRNRGLQNNGAPISKGGSTTIEKSTDHPAGEIKHGAPMRLLRMFLFTTYFLGSCICLLITQLLGAPLYFFNKDLYYAYMAVTKQAFGVLIITITQWFAPTIVRVSGDASMRGQLKQASDGRLITTFPERLVMIANHQLYTDWLYLWWIAYTSRMHGHIFIVLKESLKYAPILGQGMMFFGFIFMSRKWTDDKPRLAHRLQKLNAQHEGPMSGSKGYDPMWFLLYPEGTNLSANTRSQSRKWAEKNSIPDLKHSLLPRSTGLFFCLQQLKDTVEWIYDCTVGYEGTPDTGYAAELYGLNTTYFQGRPPKSVNMYWRRFHMSTIPLNDPDEFAAWLSARWREKDQLLQEFKDTGRFPADTTLGKITGTEKTKGDDGYINTQVKLEKWWEIGQIFVTLAAFALIVDCIVKLLNFLLWPFRGSRK